MIETLRWFGPQDPVSMSDIKQAGAIGIVSALHDKYDGRVWSLDDVKSHKSLIEAAGFSWSVCESIPMHRSILLRRGPYKTYLEQWKQTLANLGQAGVPVVCYNFMPVVDWTRTNLHYPTATGSEALKFEMPAFAAYDLYVLEREGAEKSYTPEVIAEAKSLLDTMSTAEIATLEETIITGLPGGEESHTRAGIKQKITEYASVTTDEFRSNLLEFLKEVVPVAEKNGTRLAIHPDDPPFSLFGLPRVVSTAEDIRTILNAVDSDANGLTLCVGSLSSAIENDVEDIAQEFASRIHFAHLRNVTCEPDRSFTESEHLSGRTNMVAIVSTLLEEEARRRSVEHTLPEIPMRPDHGHIMLDDIGKTVNAGYSYIGRMRGLAELRGVARAATEFLEGRLKSAG